MDYEGSSGELKGDLEEQYAYVPSHPLLTFRMMYRFVFDLVKFKEIPGISLQSESICLHELNALF